MLRSRLRDMLDRIRVLLGLLPREFVGHPSADWLLKGELSALPDGWLLRFRVALWEQRASARLRIQRSVYRGGWSRWGESHHSFSESRVREALILCRGIVHAPPYEPGSAELIFDGAPARLVLLQNNPRRRLEVEFQLDEAVGTRPEAARELLELILPKELRF